MTKELESLKAELKSKGTEREMPDDVRDIPLIMSADEYSKEKDWRVIWIADSLLNVVKRHIDEDTINSWDDIRISRHIAFPTEEYAKMYREKCQYIADMLHFKWMYDRDYVPVWAGKRNFCIAYDVRDVQYTVNTSSCFDNNSIYFSTQAIAEKCAEWLNYKYKKGEYSEAGD